MNKFKIGTISLLKFRFILIFLLLSVSSFFLLYLYSNNNITMTIMLLEHLALVYYITTTSLQKREQNYLSDAINDLTDSTISIEKIKAGQYFTKNIVLRSFNNFIDILFNRFKILKNEISRLSVFQTNFDKLIELSEKDLEKIDEGIYKTTKSLTIFDNLESRLTLVIDLVHNSTKNYSENSNEISLLWADVSDTFNWLGDINISRFNSIKQINSQSSKLKNSLNQANSYLVNIEQKNKLLLEQFNLMEEVYGNFNQVVEDMHLLAANIAIESAKIGIDSFTMISDNAREQVGSLNKIKSSFYSVLYNVKQLNTENQNNYNYTKEIFNIVSSKMGIIDDNIIALNGFYEQEKEMVDASKERYLLKANKQHKIASFIQSIYNDSQFLLNTVAEMRILMSTNNNSSVLANIKKVKKINHYLKSLSRDFSIECKSINKIMDLLDYKDSFTPSQYFRQEERKETFYRFFIYNSNNDIKMGFLGDYSFKGISFISSMIFYLYQDIDSYIKIPTMFKNNFKEEIIYLRIRIVSVNYYYDILDEDNNTLFRYGCEIYYFNQDDEMIMHKLING